MFTKTSDKLKGQIKELTCQQIAVEFVDMLDIWYSLPYVHDNELESYILHLELLAIDKQDEYEKMIGFAPSSANSCLRELFHKMKGDKRDYEKTPPHQERWKKLGTKIGEMIQHDLLRINKHYCLATGLEPKFKMKFIKETRPNLFGIQYVPAWELFMKKQTHVEYNGFQIPIQGQPDGILTYEGKKIGLEIKSKQTSHSKTSYYSMKGPEISHLEQVHTYSILYGIDEFIILYVNAAKYGWNPKIEDLQKYPDIRAFHVSVTKDDRNKILDKFSYVLQAVEDNNPPPLDVSKWTFNNYKNAIVKSVSGAEIRELEEQYKICKEKLDSFIPTPKQKNPPYQLKSEVENYESILSYIKNHK